MAKILVIDDEKLVLYTLRGALESAGHTVVEAENGVQGLARREEQHFDLVVTDILMPEKDGVETIRELRQLIPSKKSWPLPAVGEAGAKAGSILPGAWERKASLPNRFRTRSSSPVSRLAWRRDERAGVLR
jgi:CheY-like chemotaxis protein